MCISESENRPTFGTRLQAFVCRLFLLCVFVITSSLTASANPLDGTVVKGQASITSSAGTVDIIQKSKRAVIDWRSFNIEANETTNFYQPSASSVTLNRVNTPDPSHINGNLNANGKVILINPNGVFFGQGSKVDVNGLVATTADTNNDQFMKGKMNFNIAGNPNATVSNAGHITAGQAGLVGLVAPNVSNSGTIDAKMGKVTLGSGDTFTMDMYGDGLINVGVSDAVQSQVIQQTGRINAAGGTIQITAGAGRQVVNSLVNVSGELNAPTAGMKNGKIIISGEGSNKTTKSGNSIVTVDGRLDVSGRQAGQTGGTIEITGDYVGVLRGARLDAAGHKGGGTVRVGGDYHGEGVTQTAKKTVIQQDTVITADATHQGNGGKVTVWADDHTDFFGIISATGGVNGGNGGFVETSGKETLVAVGSVDASAAKGNAGLWLLDPRNITIQTTGPDTNITGNPTWIANGNNAILTVASVVTALNAGTSVSVSTGSSGGQNGNITVANAIAKTAGGDATLTLQAANNILVNAAITSTSGKLHIVLDSDNDNGASNSSGAISVGANLTSNGGNITMGGGTTPGSTAAYGNATVNDAVTISGATVDAGGGNISMRGHGYTNAATNGWGVWITSSSTVQTSGTGTITLNGTGGGGSIDTETGVAVQGGSIVSAAGGNITITGTGGGTGSNGQNYGVLIKDAGSTVRTTGAGGITITGTGGGGTGGFNTGVMIETTDGVQTTGGGTITLVGTGGGTGGTAGVDNGVWVNGGSVTGSGGAISITGTGGGSNGSWNDGIGLSAAAVTNTGSGTISMTGTGAGVTDADLAYGIELETGTVVSTVNGNITLNGTGGGAGTGGGNRGFSITSGGGAVTTTGTGNITVTGHGGNTAGSGTDNYGVYLGDTNALQTTGSGNITVTGTGTSNSGANNFGVYITGIDGIHTAGSGDITVNSFGGGGYHNHAIVLTDGSITAAGGDIGVSGTGGTGGDSGAVELNNSSIATTGAGTITITGNGGADGDDNFGVGMFGASSITTTDGLITVTGTGGGTGGGGFNYGVLINDTGSIATTGTGSIGVTGTGGNIGDYNYGIELTAANGIWAKGGGNITVTGTAGGTGSENVGVNLEVNGGITGTGGTIIVTGTGGAAFGNYNGGVEVASAAAISNTGSGTVTVTGIAGANGAYGGFGIEIDNGGVISTVDGLLTVSGTGGAGSGGGGSTTDNWGVVVWNAGSSITTTGTGNIMVSGQGGVNTFGDGNIGVLVADAGSISAAGAGDLAVTGTGGNAGGAGVGMYNAGVRLDGGSVTAAGGDISLTGTGGNGFGDWNSGLDIGTSSYASPSLVSTTGGGTISMTGTGMGDNNASHALGLDLWGGGVISAVDGTITITGTGGGAGGGSGNHGVGIEGAGTSVTTSGSGNIIINGAGTDAVFIGAAGDTTYGVNIANDGSVVTGSGNITITGTGGYGSGTDNNGVFMDVNGLISSVNGNIAVTGFGGEASAHTWGVQLNGSTISSTGSGNVSVTGTGGGGTGSEGIGVEIWAASMVSTFNGDVTVTGTGGNGAGTSNNYGVWLDEFSTNRVASTGSGNITVTGTGGNTSGDNNIGILLEEDNTIYASGSGNITVTGTGGGTGTGSYGIEVSASSARTPVRSDGAGNITMTSTGANGATDLFFTGSTATIGSGTASGNITFVQDTAIWGSASPNTSGTVTFTPRSVNTSVGVAGGAGTLDISSAVLNTNGVNRATLVVIGRSDGTGAMNVNAHTWTTGNCPLCSALLRTGSGVMTIAGAQAMGSNNLTLQTDSNLVLSAALGGTGTLTIQGSADATSMGLDGAAGTLNLSTAELGQLTNGWGSIVLGRTTGTGDITANGFTWNDNVTIQNGSGDITLAGGNGTHNFGANSLTMTTATGGDITVGGATTVGAFSAVATGGGVSLDAITAATIFARTTGGSGDITLTGNSSASAAGDAIVLASSHNFVNSAGASALTTPAGRWLSYSTVYSADTVGGLTENFHRFGCTYGGSCPAFPAGGNGFLYVNAPNLTITPVAVAGVTYGDAAPSLTNYTYTISGYVGSDGSSDVVSGSVNGSTLYTQGSNAGTYSIDYASGALSSTLGYGFTYANNAAGLVVGKRALTATVQNKTITYGTATPTLDKNSAGDVTWGNFYGTDTTAAITSTTFTYGGATAGGFNNAGSYTLGASAITSTNYTLGTVTTGTLTINPYALSVTANAQSKTYGAIDPTLTYGYGTLQNGDTAAVFSGVLNRAAGQNVGTYAINQGSLSAGSNYTISFTGANLTITPHTLSVTANAQSKAYGAADPALTYTNGALQNGDTTAVFSGALTRAAGENVGAYAISQGTLSAGSNYTISYTGANLTINPYTLSVTANAQSKTYGAADPALTYSNGALQNGDTAAVFSGALTRAAGENVGAYAIGQGTLSAGSNYTISYTGANLTITPYVLSVTANAQGKTYGAADPALTYSNGALQNGDTSAVFSGALTRAAGENVGAYAISQGTLSAGSNYTISYTGANLTITPYTLSVTANAQGKTYGAADPALTYTNGALQNGDTAAVFSGALTRAAGENVGAYAIGQGTLSAGSNYTLSYTGANLTITPYTLSVTANAQGKTYGASDPALTYSNGALQNGDTAAVFSGALTRAAGENVGAYAISQGTLSAGSNYTISYTGANLTITPYTLSVTANAQGKTYGAADPALTYSNGALQNGDTSAVFSGALTRAAGENVGAYAISQGTLSAGSNYTISYTGANLTITPYTLSVTANAQGKTYGAADPALTYSNGTLQNGDTAAVFSGALTRAAGENVGAYAISQGTLSAGSNYTLSYTGANLTITPYTLSVTANAQSKAYGAADPALTYSNGALQNGDTAAVFSGALTRAAGENVGAYAIGQGTLSAGSNYTISYTGANLSITPYVLSVTANAQGKTYGAADPALTYSNGALQNGDTAAVFSGALTRAAGENVGAYAISQGTLSAGSNYTISYTGSNLTITPYTLSVTANAQGKTYGAADPALTYSNGALQNGDTAAVFSGALTRAAGENVGAYAIGQGTLSAGANYTLSYTGANLTITPYTLSVTANAQGKTYGAADPALTYSNGALQNGDTAAVFSGALTRAAGENVGAYAISQGTLSAGSNYTISYTGANLSITPYTLSVTANAQGKTYGAADPALTYSNGALQNGDTAAVFSGGLTRVAGENVGAYAISQGTLSAGSNYTISYTGSNLTITPYTLSVTANAQSKTYGAADPALTYANGALQNGDTAAVFSGALTRAAGENAGAYAISQGTLSAGSNYTISYTGANLTITPYALSVTANAQGKTYGAADPALTYSNGALQNGDTAAVFSGALSRAAGENVGAYAIGQGTLSAGGNYTISYTGANLSITPYVLSVTADAQGKTYGAADPALTYTNGALQNGDTAAVFSGALSRAAGENVGAYAIGQGTLSAGSNYTISYTGANLTITPYTLSVTADAQGKTFGAADPALTYTYGALQNGDTAAVFSGALTRVAGESVGTYGILQGTLAAGSNYAISYTGANLTISPAAIALTITAGNTSKVYGTAHTFAGTEFTAVGLQGADTVTSVTLTSVGAAASAGVGTYAIVASNAVGSGLTNYTITYVDGVMTVTPYTLSVTADTQGKTYGAADPALTYTYGALQGGDTAAVFTGGLTRAAGENVGAYAIGQGTLSAGANYTLSYTGANLTITPYALSVTANAQSKSYGAADPALTYANGALQNGDTAAVFSGALTRAAGENVGAYAIGQGTLSAGSNYTISYTGANLSVTPYVLSVTANAQGKTYGAADPALTYSNAALQNGDTAAVFSGALTRVAGENVGAYAISQGTLSAGSNYTISYTGANLTITPYTLSVTANAQGKTYGAADPALTYSNGALQNGDTAAVFSGGLTRVAGENVGAYAISQGTLSAGSNYTISYTGANLTITPYTLSVTANAQSKAYGAADPALTYSNGALQNGDTAAVFSGALTRAAGENVGAYAIGQGTLSAGSNYTISYTGANLSITPYVLSVTANAQGKTYGAADPALTYSNGALQNGDTAAVFSGALTRVAGENVGAYAISQGTLSAGSNYTISYTGANLTITPYALSVTANAQGKTYGAADPALTYANGALQNGDTAAVFSGALTRVAGENVGAYAIGQGTLSAGSNYTISYTGANLTITPYALSVTADAQGKTYGAADPALTYTNGALQNGDTAAVFSGSLTRVAGENVGAYAIGQGTLSAGSNYTISYTGANLTITPYTLSVTANAQGKTYGAADPALTYANGALQNGDTAAVFSGALTRAAGENVGAYAIGQGTLSAGSNYTISYTGANLTITPYALTVTANAQGKTYGAADPALTYTNGALQNGDTAAIFTGAQTRVAGENVGVYAISQGTLSAGSNYTITYTGANMTITPYALSVTADAQGKTYGAADPALTYTYGTLQNGDTAAIFSGAMTRVAGENVGAYAISQGTLAATANYTISFTGANLTITPYALSVVADAQGKTYGAADPALTYTYGALQNGDTAAVFSGALTRAVGENVGAYAISQGTLSAGSNYTIAYTGANLTITPYALSVTANAQGKTYGAADPALTYTNGALQNGDTAAVFSGALTRAAGENVGAYAIGQGTLSAGSNYTISYTGANLTISPYALTVTADAQGKTYGAADPALTYTYGALQNGDTAAIFSGSQTRVAGENIGVYAISQGTLSAGSNYTVTYTGANMTITPYALTVNATAQGKVYGAADPALAYTYGTLQNGDTAAIFSGGLTRVAGENVGAYAISQGTLAATANYTISFTGANLTITPYALSVVADAQGKTYGAADPALTYTYGALQNGDTAAVFSGALTRAVGENVGAYAIGQGTVSAGSNYTISYTSANLNITPYTLAVAADAQSKVYGAADPALTYTYGALQNGDTAAVFSGGLTRAAGQNVGVYAIGQGTLSAGGNYAISYTGANLSITPYALAVTANAQGKTYGAADPALTYTYGALQNGDTAAIFTGAMTRAAGQNVGVYAVTQGTLAASANYAVTFTGNNFTITPATLNIRALNQMKIFANTFTFTGTEFATLGLVAGDSVTGVTLASAGAAAAAATGPYAITASGAVGTGLGNYTITYIDGTMNVLSSSGALIPNTVVMTVQGEGEEQMPSAININLNSGSLGDASIMDSGDLISMDPVLAARLGLSKQMKPALQPGL